MRTVIIAGAMALMASAGASADNANGGLFLAQAAPHMHGEAGAHAAAHEQVREVPADTAPAVAFTMTSDTTGGWHIALDVTNFTFSPEHADGEHVAGEGHAHLYVDGEKITRVYATDHYLAPLPAGTHEVVVGLYGNDHMAYGSDDGRLAAARYIVDVREEGRAIAAPAQIVDLSIREGRLADAEESLRVTQGETVALRWTVDQSLELHLHGYDIEAHVTPEMTTTLYFEAYAAGRFPVNVHSADGEGEVLFLEVYPN